MLQKRTTSDGTWGALAVLLVGLVLGVLARPWVRSASTRVAAVSASRTVPTPPELLLLRLELAGTPDAAEPRSGFLHAEGIRHAIQCRSALPSEESSAAWPPLEVRLSGGSFLGLQAFTLRAPDEGALWRWLLHTAARREDLLAPRSTLVRLQVDDTAPAVFLLEEAVGAGLLESAGRSDGPVVAWGDDVDWGALLLDGNLPTRGPRAEEPEPRTLVGEIPFSALAGAAAWLQAARARQDELRRAGFAASTAVEQLHVAQAAQDARADLPETWLDLARLGRAHALLSLFQDERASAWRGMRFHFDAPRARLEPILLEVAPERPSARDPVPFRAAELSASLAASPGYYAALFESLGSLASTCWLDRLFRETEDELARFAGALAPLPFGSTPAEMRQRLRAQALFLRQTCLPADATRHEATHAFDPERGPVSGSLRVRAWGSTRSPVQVEGFRFPDGGFLAASAALLPGELGASQRGSAVLLPPDGRPLTFVFPVDARHAHLEHVDKLTRVLRAALQSPEEPDLGIRMVTRLLFAAEAREEPLRFHPSVELPPRAGRPRAPTLDECLARHPFLRYDPGARRLAARPGDWTVEGDLVLPERVALALEGGTELAFGPGAVLVATAAVRCQGTETAPARLVAQDPERGWAGLAVLGSRERSHWEHVVVRDTRSIARGGWSLPGGVTFHRAAVTLAHCRFEGTGAEDALNVVGCEVLLDRVTFLDCAADAFDGDSVQGEVRASTFVGGGGDGLDVSGSTLVVRACSFEGWLDKAVSAGERSRLRIEGGSARAVGIGVASMDGSEVTVRGMTILEARVHALAAFERKPGLGPARLQADQLVLPDSGGGEAVAQTGSTLLLDGVPIRTRVIDVEASYAEGRLGRAR